MNEFRDTTELQVTIGGAFGGGDAGSCETDARTPGGVSERVAASAGGATSGEVAGTPCPHWRQMQTIPRGTGGPPGAVSAQASSGTAATSPHPAGDGSHAGMHPSRAPPETGTQGVHAAGPQGPPHDAEVSQAPIARHIVSACAETLSSIPRGSGVRAPNAGTRRTAGIRSQSRRVMEPETRRTVGGSGRSQGVVRHHP